MDFSIIIPVYNSVESLPMILEEIEDYFEDESKGMPLLKAIGKESEDSISYEILFVDDASESPTKEALKKVASNEHVKILHLKQNRGQQEALLVGFLNAHGSYAITLDDDLQHPFAEFMDQIVKAFPVIPEYFLCYGIDDTNGGAGGRNWIRGYGSRRVATFFAENFPILSGKKVSSLRFVTKNIYTQLAPTTNFVYISVLLLDSITKLKNNGIAMNYSTINNVKIKRRPRKYGKSGYTLFKCIKTAALLFGSRPKARGGG